jgi:hypothetical protein
VFVNVTTAALLFSILLVLHSRRENPLSRTERVSEKRAVSWDYPDEEEKRTITLMHRSDLVDLGTHLQWHKANPNPVLHHNPSLEPRRQQTGAVLLAHQA